MNHYQAINVIMELAYRDGIPNEEIKEAMENTISRGILEPCIMSNDEAIALLQEFADSISLIETRTALNMGIKALKQQEVNKMPNFTIDRNENGFHIHGMPYWDLGTKIQPLYQTCQSYEDCEKWLDKEYGKGQYTIKAYNDVRIIKD